MKRRFFILCAAICVMIAMLGFSTALADSHTVKLNVDFEKNLIFSKYDVEVYLDDARVGSYTHGENFNVSFTTDDGDHTVWFYEDGDHSNKGSIAVTVSSDTVISCHIECKNNKVKVTKVDIDRGGSSDGILDLTGSGRSAAAEEAAADDPDRDDIGTTQITNDGVSFTLLDVVESEGNSYSKPDSGKIFVLAQFLVENNTNSDYTVSSMMDFDTYCDGFSCEFSFNAYMVIDEQLDGTIAAGKKMKGWLGYEVDKAWKEFEIQIQPNLFSSEKLIFITHKK